MVFLRGTRPDLADVVEAWGDLPEAIRTGIVAMVQVAPLRAVHKVVTDDGIPATAVRAIEVEGVEVITPSRMPGGLVADGGLSRLPLGPMLLDQGSRHAT